MTTSPHSPDDDAPPTHDEQYDDAGRYIGDEAPVGDEVSAPGDRDDDGLDEEPPAIQPRS
jgi:hypothetical protein